MVVFSCVSDKTYYAYLAFSWAPPLTKVRKIFYLIESESLSEQSPSLFSSVRAGALKAQLLIYASIIEAALLSHALARKYDMGKKPWTFGNVLNSWDNVEELNTIGNELEKLKNIRDHIHLDKISSQVRFYQDLVKDEKKLIEMAANVIRDVQGIKS